MLINFAVACISATHGRTHVLQRTSYSAQRTVHRVVRAPGAKAARREQIREQRFGAGTIYLHIYFLSLFLLQKEYCNI